MDDELISELDGYLETMKRELKKSLELRKDILAELER